MQKSSGEAWLDPRRKAQHVSVFPPLRDTLSSSGRWSAARNQARSMLGSLSLGTCTVSWGSGWDWGSAQVLVRLGRNECPWHRRWEESSVIRICHEGSMLAMKLHVLSPNGATYRRHSPKALQKALLLAATVALERYLEQPGGCWSTLSTPLATPPAAPAPPVSAGSASVSKKTIRMILTACHATFMFELAASLTVATVSVDAEQQVVALPALMLGGQVGCLCGRSLSFISFLCDWAKKTEEDDL